MVLILVLYLLTFVYTLNSLPFFFFFQASLQEEYVSLTHRFGLVIELALANCMQMDITYNMSILFF